MCREKEMKTIEDVCYDARKKKCVTHDIRRTETGSLETWKLEVYAELTGL